MSRKLKISGKTPATVSKTTPEKTEATKADVPMTHAALPTAAHGKGGVYRSIGGGKRVRI